MEQETVIEDIKKWLHTKWLGQEFIYDKTVDSTNTRIKALAEAGAAHGTVAAAGTQTAGKGRRGRGWVSPEDVNVYLSVLFRPDFPADRAPMLTLVTAYAMAQAVREVTDLPVEVKWPNDLVIRGRKICGILTEMSMAGENIKYVVTGIGINTNMRDIPGEISGTATSLLLEGGVQTDRMQLIGVMLNHLEKAYDRYTAERNLMWLKKEYNDMLAGYGKPVRILDPLGEYDGVSCGIDDEGCLLVRKEDGTQTRIYSGEVSVRGVYGYADES